jgi:hypothetical protein
MKKKINTFNQSSSYRKFVNQRDGALEKILRNTRLRIASKLNNAFVSALTLIQKNYKSLATMYHPSPIKMRLASQEAHINHIFEQTATQIAYEIIKQRRKAYTLAYAGEAEAMGQTMGKKLKYKLSKHDLDQWSYAEPFADGKDVLKKVDLYLNRLRRVLMNELELAIMLDDSVEKALGRLILKLPKKKQIDQARKLKKVPTKVREANKPLDFQFIDDETWNEIVKDYTDEYVPTDRSPESVFDAVNPYNDEPIREDIPSDEAFYGWEVEQDTTHDFVQQVRDGQVDAANMNGINEFVWIAITDSKTDECCLWRDGKITKEIESEMKDHDDECDAVTPPAHFNCRCRLAPYDDNADEQDYDNLPDYGDFEEWINS